MQHSRTTEFDGQADICARLLIPHFHCTLWFNESLNTKQLPSLCGVAITGSAPTIIEAYLEAIEPGSSVSVLISRLCRTYPRGRCIRRTTSLQAVKSRFHSAAKGVHFEYDTRPQRFLPFRWNISRSFRPRHLKSPKPSGSISIRVRFKVSWKDLF